VQLVLLLFGKERLTYSEKIASRLLLFPSISSQQVTRWKKERKVEQKKARMTSSDIFKKFTLESVAQMASTSMKDQKRMRDDLFEQFPLLADHWEDILPKKTELMLVRCHDQVFMVTHASQKPEVLFFRHHDGPYLPHLKVLHRYPFILKRAQVDIGGCKYVVSGANIMCQGLTSPGGALDDTIVEGDVVALHVEGKRHAVGVGIASMTANEIRAKNKGPCIDNVHHLGDGLWMNPVLSASSVTKRKE
jgi:PUA domain protein